MRSLPLALSITTIPLSLIGLVLALYNGNTDTALGFGLLLAAFTYINYVIICSHLPKVGDTCTMSKDPKKCMIYKVSDSGCVGCEMYKVEKR